MTGRYSDPGATHYRTAMIEGVEVFYREAGPPDAPEHREASRAYRGPESIRAQYLFGVKDPSLVDPDNWTINTALIDRPGVDEIMLDLLYDIRTNVPTFTAMQRFVRGRQPPTLVTAGVNDEVFPGEVQRQILTDLPAAEFHALDTGHCALEDQAPEIARLMRGFLDRVLAPEVTRTRS